MSAPLREHTFDGIQEMDSHLPNWWLWTFYGACIFSVVYWIAFHTLGTADQPYEAYLEEERAAYLSMQEHMMRNPVTEESLLKLAASPAAVAEGEKTFKAICAQCHLSHGGGSNSPLSIGPNLTDGFWINGGSPLQIHHTVMHGGREGKGMQAWAVNGPVFVQNATAYVLSIKNTNVKGGKDPEPEAKPEK